MGTAALPGLFYLTLNKSGDYRGALVTALVVALVGMVACLVLATFDWQRDRHHHHRHRKCPDEVANNPVHARQD